MDNHENPVIRRVNHVVLSVADLNASTAFYTDVLGLALVSTLPRQGDWPEMRFFRSPGPSSNHHDLGIIGNATGPVIDGSRHVRAGLFHVAFEVGTIAELEDLGQRLKDAGALRDQVHQPMHLSLYACDPDGIAVEVIWRVPDTDWTYDDLWRKPLDIEAVKARWGGALVTGSAAGDVT